MNLFANYIQPLTDWLQTNPKWALFITFFIALSESLVLIGSIIPGSVTMTAIGILAGSGVMRLDLTLISATLGAIAGDSISYALGYIYSEQITEIWPFKKYPKWVSYGKEFFAKHGGKSVLLGRFVGPLRSLIPVIAGIVHMKQWRFLIANFLSAIGWSLLYILPGVMIGAASHGLSAEMATHLFALILFILAVIWLGSLLLRWLFIRLNAYLKIKTHSLWLHFKKYSKYQYLYQAITPSEEKQHHVTAGIVIITLLSFLIFIIITLLTLTDYGIKAINLPIHFFLQSFHTPILEAFFIICTQLTDFISLITLYFLSCMWFCYHKKYKIVMELSSIVGLSFIIGFLLSYLIHYPRPQGIQTVMSGSSFLPVTLLTATAFYTFIMCYINTTYSLMTHVLRTSVLIIIILSGIGSIYLGDVWFTDVLAAYSAGLVLGLLHYLIYRKTNSQIKKLNYSMNFILLLLIGLLSSVSLSIYLNFKTSTQNHTPYQKKQVLTESSWWNQHKPLLPLYRLNRVGNKINLLNIQYAGSLETLQKSLEKKGWTAHTESFFTKILIRMSNSKEVKFPILSPLYENKAPKLVMTYDQKSDFILELNIWESNYLIPEIKGPIFIGTLHQNLNNLKSKKPSSFKINLLSYLIPALKEFTLRQIALPETNKPTLDPNVPIVLLIKENCP